MRSLLLKKDAYEFYYEEGIVIAQYKVDFITEEVADNIIKDKLEYCASYAPMRLIIDMGKVSKMDSKARKRLKNSDANDLISESAVVIKSRIQEIILTFYMRICKPKVPIKVFSSFENAYDWLKSKNDEYSVEEFSNKLGQE